MATAVGEQLGNELRSELQVMPGLIFLEERSLIRQAEEVFPFAHGRPNWKAFSKHISVDWDGSHEDAYINILALSRLEGLLGDVSYVGDGLTSISFAFDFSKLDAVLKAVIRIPHHHYLFNVENGWMYRLSFENDFDLGVVRPTE